MTSTKIPLGVVALGRGACSPTQERMNGWVGTTDAHPMSARGTPDLLLRRADVQIASDAVTPRALDPSSIQAGLMPVPVEWEGAMRVWPLVAMALVMAVLGLGTFLAALDVAESSLNRTLQLQPYAPARDEMGRPLCRRNNFADPQRPLPRVGDKCL
jgi:hypothetical protein